MAMRPRRGGLLPPRPSMRPIYESFRPRYEWKYEKNAVVLFVYVPGFVREQIRIEVDKSRQSMQIQGQRPLGAGRWSIFNQSFPIPSECDWTRNDIQFELGVLTITVPYKFPLTTPDQVTAQPKTTPQQQLPTATTPTLQDEKVALQDASTTSKASTVSLAGTGKQPDHRQERDEPTLDEELTDETEATSSDDDHKLPKLEKVDGKKQDKEANIIPDEKLPKAEEKDHMLKKGDAEDKVKAKNAEHEKESVEKGTVKMEEQALLINIVIAAVVLMGLGAYIFSIIGSSKTA